MTNTAAVITVIDKGYADNDRIPVNRRSAHAAGGGL